MRKISAKILVGSVTMVNYRLERKTKLSYIELPILHFINISIEKIFFLQG